LTGKYEGGAKPKDARHTLFPKFQSRYFEDRLCAPISEYSKIAKEADMSVTTLALAFCKSQVFIPSTIIGATTMQQLKENIAAFSIKLPQSVLDSIDDVHRRYPNASNFDG